MIKGTCLKEHTTKCGSVMSATRLAVVRIRCQCQESLTGFLIKSPRFRACFLRRDKPPQAARYASRKTKKPGSTPGLRPFLEPIYRLIRDLPMPVAPVVISAGVNRPVNNRHRVINHGRRAVSGTGDHDRRRNHHRRRARRRHYDNWRRDDHHRRRSGNHHSRARKRDPDPDIDATCISNRSGSDDHRGERNQLFHTPGPTTVFSISSTHSTLCRTFILNNKF